LSTTPKAQKTTDNPIKKRRSSGVINTNNAVYPPPSPAGNQAGLGQFPLSPNMPVDQVSQAPAPQPTSPGLGIKEREVFARQDEMQLEEIRKELELTPEVKEAGVEVKREEIELPEPVKKMGVVPTDIAQPVTPPTINLPLTDDKIVTGFGAPIITSLRWLVEWCIRQLKRVHVKLKKIHGQIVRVVTK